MTFKERAALAYVQNWPTAPETCVSRAQQLADAFCKLNGHETRGTEKCERCDKVVTSETPYR